MRAVVLAVLLVLACTFTLSAASSADWAAPSLADAFNTELSANELEARQMEFSLLAVTGESSSSAVNNVVSSSSADNGNSSSSTGTVSAPLLLTAQLDCTVYNGSRQCAFTAEDFKQAINDTYGFPSQEGESLDADLVGITVTVADVSSSTAADSSSAAADASSTGAESSSTAVGRRLLATVDRASLILTFMGALADAGEEERRVYTIVAKSLACSGTVSEKKACVDAVAASYGVPSLSDNPTFLAVQASVVPGSVTSDAAITNNTPGQFGNNVASSGGPRRTNGGFYFLGAVVLVFIVVALVYFIVHKKPDNVIAVPVRGGDAELAPVVAAPGTGVVVGEDAALAGGAAGQMDYRSVFALKHNVLDKNAEQKDDEHNHQDVHFILHQ